MNASRTPVHAADSNSIHKFPYSWNLSDLKDTEKNGLNVFSCFSCGGGSSMGYKLAGYNVVGNLEIDPAMNDLYKTNHHPKYSYQMDIRDFNNLEKYPDELKKLDILDGSPPCSVFSMAGYREDAWGIEKRFREGQEKQKLDDLFMHFIQAAKILRPKVIIAENVEGLICGAAKGYVNEIVKAFRDAGYVLQLFLLDSSSMGVPQRRKRVFFIGYRKDLNYPKLKLDFNEFGIPFRVIRSEHGLPFDKNSKMGKLIKMRKPGDKSFNDISMRVHGIYSMYNEKIINDNEVSSAITSSGTFTRYYDGMKFTNQDFSNAQTFPQDYNFKNQSVQYVCGMSVPPVMMAQIASQIYEQWQKGQ